METLFFRSSRPEAKDVLVVNGGFDSTLEELYFTIGSAAIERGFHVLIFEGPGQGNLLRRYNLPLTHAWEKPAAAAIDSLPLHCKPHRIIGVGISLGDECTVEAGLYVTAGTMVKVLPDGDVVKARDLSGAGGLLYRRNSQSGAVEALPRSVKWSGLNAALHHND